MALLRLCVVVLVSMAVVIMAKPQNVETTALECSENEIYYKCDLEFCGMTTCEQHLKSYIPPCASVVAGCFQPACLCKGGYLRNDKGVCVRTEECDG